ncbi:MAG: acyl-CoA dehydrogenase family protein, partial [Pedobacter sp.]
MEKTAKKDLYEAPDYYLLDELLTDEHKLIRSTTRDWVKKELSPIIEDFAQRAEFPKHLIKGLGEIGAFGPTIPVEYGGAGLDYISYG